MKLKQWQKHIGHTRIPQNGTAWCGADLSSLNDQWHYIDIDHAAYSAPRDRIQPCPACIKAIHQSLKGVSPQENATETTQDAPGATEDTESHPEPAQ